MTTVNFHYAVNKISKRFVWNIRSNIFTTGFIQIFKYFSVPVYRDRAFTFVSFRYYFSRLFHCTIYYCASTCYRSLNRFLRHDVIFMKIKQVVFYTFKWRLRCSLNTTRTTIRVNYRGGYNSYFNANKSYARSDVDVYASKKRTCIAIGTENSARPNW